MSAPLKYAIYLMLLTVAGFALYAGFADLPAPTRSIEAPAPAPQGGSSSAPSGS